MLNNDLVNAFNDCIDRLAAGQSLEECLRIYPQFAADLEPMLLAGQLALRAQPTAVEVDLAKNRQRGRFEQSLRTPPTSRKSQPHLSFTRVVGIAASFIFIFAILLGGTTLYAQRSLPGDTLYGLKLVSEDGRLLVASITGDKDSLEADFEARRIDETKDLLDLGREETVEFEGIITDKQETPDGYNIVVSALTITAFAENDLLPPFDSLQIGDRIRVEGRTTPNGTVLAQIIRILNRQPDENQRPDIPSPTPTPIIQPSPTSTPTQRPSPTPTRQHDGINDRTPIPTLEPTRPIDVPPTARPPTDFSPPTPIPPTDPPRDNGGDGGNDGGSDSGGGDDRR